MFLPMLDPQLMEAVRLKKHFQLQFGPLLSFWLLSQLQLNVQT